MYVFPEVLLLLLLLFGRIVNDDNDVEREQYKLNEMAALWKNKKTHIFHNETPEKKAYSEMEKGGRDEKPARVKSRRRSKRQHTKKHRIENLFLTAFCEL